jgi:hypothetical protein
LSLSLQPWRWCLRSSSVNVLSKGKKKIQTKQKKTTQNKKKNTTKCSKFKTNTVSVGFSACRCSSVVVSSKEEREKGVWRQF